MEWKEKATGGRKNVIGEKEETMGVRERESCERKTPMKEII